ncbi:YfbU family protein [Sphingomonas naphthae]|uniref:YfbU family protein n=1 Tax=Sphingomonas naphthae TaxID=1813468 RepID=A0ABY7TR61_9SPHN|nr:YfbU family protein [Sphingomonas naphthae]WCT75518.1 YfbU family protein [Sphingomonas naphthae]
MKLSQTERLILWNQYEILKGTNPEEIDIYEKNQEILSNGYELLYQDLNRSIDPDPLSAVVCMEVLDILSMYRAITFSSQRLKHEPTGLYAQFEGFDGNSSSGHYGFAKFVRRTEKRYEELEERPDNSHSGTSLAAYRAMLKVWESLGKNYKLAVSEIDSIVSAR